ncbi:11387_t:CDS:2, partial [Racocetra persica]
MPRKRKELETCGNPLYLKWLGEWMESASAANNKAYYTYKKAYDSMSKYPLPFQHPAEAAILSGIGPGICQRLEMRLKQHCEETGQPPPQRPGYSDEPEPKRQKTTTAPKVYVPKYRSGAYAIMLALYKASEIDSNPNMTKPDLIKEAQRYCDASFDIPSGKQKFYTAWNSMKTLLDKNYVYKNGYPSRFSLTESGLLVARQMVETANLQGNNPFSNFPSTQPANLDDTVVHTTSLQGNNPFSNFPSTQPANLDDAVVHTTSLQGNNPFSNFLSTQPANLDDTVVHTTSLHGNNSFSNFPSIQPANLYNTTVHTVLPTKIENHTVEKKPIVIDLRESSDEECCIQKESKLPSNDSSGFKPLYRSSSSDIHSDQAVMLDNTTVYNVLPTNIKNHTIEKTPVIINLEESSDEEFCIPKEFKPFLNDIAKSKHLCDQVDNNKHAQSVPTTISFDSNSSTSSTVLNNFSPIVWESGTFEIILVLDTREVKLKKDRDYIKDTLQEKGVPISVRNLELGDVIWVARKNTTSPMEELALDYILERKRMDDLVGSIKDGRFREQKFRLSKSGASQIIYLIEDYNLEEVAEFGIDAIKTALSSIQMLNGYFLKRTATIDQSIDYLVRMTRMLKAMYENTTLYAIPDNMIYRSTFLDMKKNLATLHPDRTYLVTYSSYSDLNSKSKPLTLRDTFVRMLMTIRGISVDKAAEIIKNYPTPRKLVEEFDSLTNEDDKRKMIMNACSGIIRRKKIGPALSVKIYQ